MIICCNHLNDDVCKQRLLEFTKECEEGCRLFLQSEHANPQGIQILGNVALVFGELSQFDKAIEVQRDVLETAETLFGKDKPIAQKQRTVLRTLIAQQRQKGITNSFKGFTEPGNKK